jgi:hypothetical protein
MLTFSVEISFGTVFWPTGPGYVDEVIEALIEKNIPFVSLGTLLNEPVQADSPYKIMCSASPFAKISPELSEKIQNSGIGLLKSWCPQQFILNHPVCVTPVRFLALND